MCYRDGVTMREHAVIVRESEDVIGRLGESL